MADTSKKPGSGPDPRPGRSRALIFTAATDHFLAHGYIGANVDEIALAAGVSKRTVYNLFHTKEELFRETVESVTEIARRFAAAALTEPVGEQDVAVELRELAVAHATAVLDPRVVRTRRLLIGEAERFPDLAAAYYAAAPARVISAIAERLSRYAERGELVLADPMSAGEHFAFLVLGASLDRALFDPVGSVDQGQVIERAEEGAARFLAAYRG